MDKIKKRWTKFMEGRYGADYLTKRTLGFAIVSFIISMTLRFQASSYFRLFDIITLVLIGFTYFRIFSKNKYQMARMNQKYFQWERKAIWPFKKIKRRIFGTKEAIYMACPNCKEELKIPRNKGKLKVTCPHCKHIFYKRT